MISFEDAQKIILESSLPLPLERLKLEETVNHIAAADITGSEMIPHFTNSAMDGFAIHAAASNTASNLNPVRLTVTGSSVAGDYPTDGKTSAWEIMTGAPIPSTYDTIVMKEHVTVSKAHENGRPAEILLQHAQPPHQHIRMAGEDFKPGDRLLRKGTRLQPQHIMALAAHGIYEINVIRTPKIHIISTGNELAPTTSATLQPGQIRDSNGPYLCTALKYLHNRANHAAFVPDIPTIYETQLDALSKTADIILSTGAVSAGRHDFIPASLKKLGAKILFHGVAIRPGKPILFARLSNGAYYFGLPGNPISSAVGLRFFVYPLLRALQGMPPERNLHARLVADIDKKPGLRFFQKSILYFDNDGQAMVRIQSGQESFKIQPLLSANAWAILPETVSQLKKGTMLTVASQYPEQLTFCTDMEH